MSFEVSLYLYLLILLNFSHFFFSNYTLVRQPKKKPVALLVRGAMCMIEVHYNDRILTTLLGLSPAESLIIANDN